MDNESAHSQTEMDKMPEEPTVDLANHVETVLKQLQSKFENMSKNILTKMDTMGSRLDELERSLGGLVQEELSQPQTMTPPQPTTVTIDNNDKN
ncbi:hypothetical protein BATDEDRAFT_91506 [Batrachochytrium dendrobatidis JAM81]|uniref:Heat shock factor binding protein 1 n=1 Tax=Batrachochytrium dendrobatidis (strain JAM81 / FGSC 10211) TaxID=684364 RepID=F4PAQ6_BATDJ|nr:uncharacterized protein BATDEDRAFT_91506 [Batrachochytrium dendrobatidis JAM81]EGF77725.1 hypothetical protein BATDEDRAFT_91506 [Batrachochytrium dendrobatidis JAM81]KAJ8323483.1 hypothetical protein O5D80_007798 [Batrachochytrium dendrobatidis]KAK5666196.1 hypothetical protein QVD99_006969 [Batrachochytrium dendrobatidis]|eukprot:XP_006681817.1 hypothetical protein BATDEDRAFT_91506 [Batrachochytrium dendrobatidis JAM81]